LIEKKLPQMGVMVSLLNKDERDILEYWNNYDKELKTIIKTRQRVFK